MHVLHSFPSHKYVTQSKSFCILALWITDVNIHPHVSLLSVSVSFFTEFCLDYTGLRPSGSGPALYILFLHKLNPLRQHKNRVNTYSTRFSLSESIFEGDKLRKMQLSKHMWKTGGQSRLKQNADKDNIKCNMETFLNKAVYDRSKWHFISETKQLKLFIIQSFVRSKCI